MRNQKWFYISGTKCDSTITDSPSVEPSDDISQADVEPTITKKSLTENPKH